MTSLALLALAAALATPTAPQLQIHVPAGEPTVGDPIVIEITLVVPQSALVGDPQFPAWDTSWGEAEIISSGSPTRLPDADDWARFQQTLTIALFRTGDVELPPISIGVPTTDGELVVEPESPIRIRIGSVLPEGEEQLEPRPPEPPRQLSIGRPFWWTLATLVAAILALLVILLRRKSQKISEEMPDVEPLVAFAQWLTALRAETDPEKLHTGLSMAFRRFLGSTVGFSAPEATTREIYGQLGNSPLPGAVVNSAVEMLKQCDQIKFARRKVTAAAGYQQIDRAAELASRINEALTPEEAEADLQEVAS